LGAEKRSTDNETRKVTFEDARQSLIKDMKGRLPERDFKLPPGADVGEDFANAAPDSSAPPTEPTPRPHRTDQAGDGGMAKEEQGPRLRSRALSAAEHGTTRA
jgi:hypothetical protein